MVLRRRPVTRGGAAALVALVAACAPIGERADRPGPAGVVRLSYEDVLAPAVFRREGEAVPETPGGAAGFWAATPGLARPERGLVENLASGARVQVSLFSGAGPGGTVRLSGAAAAEIGLAGPGRVRITALRREPRIAGP